MIESFASLPLGEIPTVSGNGITPFEFPDEEFELYSVPAHETGAPEIVRGIEIGSNKQIVSEGMVLLCKINPRINRVWVVRAASKYRQIASTEWITFDRNDSVNPEYLAHFLRQTEVRDFLAANASGVGGSLMRVKASTLAHYSFGLFGREMQRLIVAKLEELLSDLDAGVAELKNAQKKLQQFRQSLLKAAVEGALTADWREAQRQQGTPTENGAQLLTRILTERRARWEAKQLAKFKEQGKAPPKDWQQGCSLPVAAEPIGLPSIPETWAWTSLGECFQVAVGATPSRKEITYWNGEIPWVSSGEVRFSRIRFTKESITEVGLNKSSTRMNPVGSVLLGMIGEGKTRGQVAILDIPAANNQNCAAIWVSETPVPSEFVYYWLWSRYDETRRGSSGNNQPALNKSIVERIAMPLPPVAEMLEVVKLVRSTMEQISEQERAVALSFKQSLAQRQNILRAAFAGQLVPQDVSDESASVLLQRIRSERPGHASQPRARKTRKLAEA